MRNREKFLILNVKEGDGFSRLKTDLEVCSTFNGKRLIETYTYSRGQPLHVIFSWSIDGEFLKRLKSSTSNIKIEIWRKGKLMLGDTTIRVQQVQFTNENSELFHHRLSLNSSISTKPKTLPLDIVVTLNIDNVQPEKPNNHISDEDSCEPMSDSFIKKLSRVEVFNIAKIMPAFRHKNDPNFLWQTSNSSADMTESSDISKMIQELSSTSSSGDSDKKCDTDSHITEDLEISYGEDSFNSYYSSATIKTELSVDAPSLEHNIGTDTKSRKKIVWPKRPKELETKNTVAIDDKVNSPCTEIHDSIVSSEILTEKSKELSSERLENECSAHNILNPINEHEKSVLKEIPVKSSKKRSKRKSRSKRLENIKEIISNNTETEELPATKETSKKPNKAQVIHNKSIAETAFVTIDNHMYHEQQLRNRTSTSSSNMDATVSNTKLKLDTVHPKSNKALVKSPKPSTTKIHSGSEDNDVNVISLAASEAASMKMHESQAMERPPEKEPLQKLSSSKQIQENESSIRNSETHIISGSKPIIPNITKLKTKNSGTRITDSNQINSENHRPLLETIEDSDNTSQILTEWSQRTSAMSMTSLETDYDISVNYHQYILNFRIISLKWYKDIEDVKVSVRFHNRMYESVVSLVENVSLSQLNIFLPEVNGRMFNVCIQKSLMDIINHIAPRFLISKYEDSKVIAGATIKLKALKMQPETEQPFTIPIIGKCKDILGKFNMLVSYYDADDLSKFHMKYKADKEYAINQVVTAIEGDVKKLFTINNMLTDLQNALNVKNVNAVYEKINGNLFNEDEYWETFMSTCTIKDVSQKSVGKTVLKTSERGCGPKLTTKEKGCGLDVNDTDDTDLYKNKYTQVETKEILQQSVRETVLKIRERECELELTIKEKICGPDISLNNTDLYNKHTQVETKEENYISTSTSLASSSHHLPITNAEHSESTHRNIGDYHNQTSMRPSSPVLISHAKEQIRSLQNALNDIPTCSNMDRYDTLLKTQHNLTLLLLDSQIEKDDLQSKYSQTVEELKKCKNTTTMCLTPRSVERELCDHHCCRSMKTFKDDGKLLNQAKKSRISAIRKKMDDISAKVKKCYKDQKTSWNGPPSIHTEVERVHMINSLLLQWNELKKELDNLLCE